MISLYICSDILPSLAAYRDMTKNVIQRFLRRSLNNPR